MTGDVVDESPENCRLSNESDCRPIEIRRGEKEKANNSEENKISENKTENITDIPEELLNLNCTESWKCVDPRYKALQYKNCSWTSIQFCVYGCKDNDCRPPLTCKPGSVKCNNDVVMKCSEDGEWKTNQSCDYKCLDGICISQNITAIINTTANLTNTNLTNTTNENNNSTNNSASQQNNFISDGCMSVSKYNLTGNNATDEYFTLKNSCSYQIDITGWTATDDASHVYKFPSFTLVNSGEVTVVTGSGSSSQTILYWGRNSAVWNNNGDTLYLNASNSASVLIKSLTP